MEGAAAWATARLEAVLGTAGSHGDAEQLAAWLPHTRAWLAAASGQLPQVEQLPGLAGTPGQGSASPAPQGAQAMPRLRAGLHAAGAAPTGGVAQADRRLPLQAPVGPRSWRGLVRLGLVQLVSGEQRQHSQFGRSPVWTLLCGLCVVTRLARNEPRLGLGHGSQHFPPPPSHPIRCCAGEGAVGRLPLPELLRLDATRLHAAQVGCGTLLRRQTRLSFCASCGGLRGHALPQPVRQITTVLERVRKAVSGSSPKHLKHQPPVWPCRPSFNVFWC